MTVAAAAGPAARGGGSGGSPAKPPAFALTPQVTLHDRANLVALPIVGGLVLAGLLGYCDTLLVRGGGASGGAVGCRLGEVAAAALPLALF